MVSGRRVFFLLCCLAPASLLAEQRTISSWYLPNDGTDFGWFGASVDIRRDTIVVGAPRGHVDDAGDRSGRAYVFQFDGTRWVLSKVLVPSEPAIFDSFGDQVSISIDTAAVEGGGGRKLFLFGRNEGGPNQWGEIKKFAFASEIDSFDLDGDTLIVNGPNAAVVIEKDAGGPENWGPIQILPHPGVTIFGGSVSVSGDTAAIASGEEVQVFYRNRNVADRWSLVKTLPFSGFAMLSGDTLVVNGNHIFDRDTGGLDHWGPIAGPSGADLVTAPNGAFGFGAALGRSMMVFGDTDADIEDDAYFQQGDARVYLRDEGGRGQWGLREVILGDDAGSLSRFGNAVAVWNDRVVVGAFLADASAEDTGAAFVYQVDTAPSASCGVWAGYATGTLTLDFTLAAPAPVTWEVWVSIPSTTAKLWSVSLPPIAPPVSFSLPITGFPHIRGVGFLSTFTSPAKGLLCSAWNVVDTGEP